MTSSITATTSSPAILARAAQQQLLLILALADNTFLVILLFLSAVCRHPNDELNYCYYLIPCGKAGYCGDVTEADLARLHNDAITKVRMKCCLYSEIPAAMLQLCRFRRLVVVELCMSHPAAWHDSMSILRLVLGADRSFLFPCRTPSSAPRWAPTPSWSACAPPACAWAARAWPPRTTTTS